MVSTIISKSSQVSDQEFDLDPVKGKVVTTKKGKIPTFQTVITKGLMKVTGHQKHVQVLVEPSPNCKGVFIPSNTSKLIPGGSGVAVVLRNLSGSEVTLEPHIEVGIVIAANMVPSIQIPDEPDVGRDEEHTMYVCSRQIYLKEPHRLLQNQKIFSRRLIYQKLKIGIPRYNRKLKI